MLTSRYDWQVKKLSSEDEQKITMLSEKAEITKLNASILYGRGFDSPEKINKILHGQIEDLYDPFLMYDMDRCIERLSQAVENSEQILIYGDYDADGITSTAVLKETLEMIGADVVTYIPNRFKEGYGPNVEAFEMQIKQGVALIITVDNGIAGNEAIARANELGVDVIVTDHHELPPVLPEAYAIVHPKHPKGEYPFPDLAGVGVAFKVATALLGELPTELLDLVAIGTVADLVSLTDENRLLVKFGLKVLQQSQRVGLQKLCQVASIQLELLTEEQIGFTLAPRLNALGRLGDAMPGVTLLTTFDDAEADELAHFIQNENQKRQGLVQEISQAALEMVANMQASENPPNVFVLAKENWHEGVLGIVASRVVEATGKPTIILNIDNENQIAKGSGRSIADFNLFAALNKHRDLFTHFGGHHMAAGMSLPSDNLNALQEVLVTEMEVQAVSEDAKANLQIDEYIALADITIENIQSLQELAPFGTDFPVPVFAFSNVNLNRLKQIGTDKQHLKVQFGQAGNLIDGIGFQMGDLANEVMPGETISVVGKMTINEWNGQQKPQIMLTDMQADGLQVYDYRAAKQIPPQVFQQKKAFYVFF